MNRILIVRLGALGDIVHAIPVAAALRRAFPAARIDWLVSAKHREILDLVPVIDRRLVVNDRRSIGSRQVEADGTSLLAAIGELRRARYDVAIDLQGLIKSAILSRGRRARRASSAFRHATRASARRVCSTPTRTIRGAAASTIRAKRVTSSTSTSGCCSLLGIAAPARGVSHRRRGFRRGAPDAGAGRRSLCAAQPGRGVAEQALAPDAARGDCDANCAAGTG